MKRIVRNSFLISISYVGVGTICALGLYPDSFFHSDFSLIGILITMPVSFLAFGIAYSESDSYLLILIVQFIVFLIFWYLIYRYMKKKY